MLPGRPESYGTHLLLFKTFQVMPKSLPEVKQAYLRAGWELSAPSPGDDLRSKSAIRLRGQTVRSDSFWEIACDFSAVAIRLRLQCILR